MTFPGFELLGRVAEGSTGVVWQARQVELDRLVAIKELSPALHRTPGFVERFRAEARTLATLDDPHVVRVFDYVEEPERAYLVQEWVDGAPLAAVLQEHGSLTPEQSLGVMRGGLIGLAHAHGRGLVHRDISPANILLDREGTSKLVDFGLATQTEEGISPGEATSVGTPAFSSPEAASGSPMTTRSDVYSAAAVLFLLLSGRLPYPGNAAQVLQAHISGAIPRLDGHGPRLTDLLARAMAKNPAERPADAAAFLAELEEAATERYGPAWLSRASVAGLVTAGAAGTTVTATAAVSGAAATPTAATTALTYGASAQVVGAHLPAAAARTGTRILGLPLAGVIIIAALVIAAIATTVIVTNNTTDPQTAANTAPGETEASSEPSPTTTEPPPAPAFSGTYQVVFTITSVNGALTASVGDVQEVTWTATATCPSGPCDVSVASSSGRQFAFSYAEGAWTSETTPDSECFDAVTGEPLGTSVPATQVIVLTPPGGVDPTSKTPILALSGTDVVTTDSGCDGAPTMSTADVQATRVGD